MALRDDILVENKVVFMETLEFATVRELIIDNGTGQPLSITVPCQWDDDILKHLPAVRISGMYLGDVMLMVQSKYFPFRPRPNQIITHFGAPYTILDVAEDFGMYKITLQAFTSPQ